MNFTKVAEVWGSMVGIDKKTAEGEGYKEARILIDTCHLPYIQGSMYLSINGCGHDIYVKEIRKGRCVDDFVDTYSVLVPHKQLLRIEGLEVETSVAELERNISARVEAQRGVSLNEYHNNYQDTGAANHNVILGIGGNNEPSLSQGQKLEREQKGKGLEPYLGPGCSLTRSLDDERRTQEVLRDLGLIKGGPSNIDPEEVNQPQCIGPFHNEEDSGETYQSFPPGFEPITLDQRLSQGDTVVPCSEPESGDIDQSMGEGSSSDISEYDEASRTWKIGKKLGLSSNAEPSIIQTFIEEKLERKMAKRNHTKTRRKERNKKMGQLTGVSHIQE